MPVPPLQAVAFHLELKTGATGPCVFACEDATGEPAGEYVVKFRSQIRGGPIGLLFEFVAAQLALRLGLRTPAPAVVMLNPPLADATPNPEVAARIRRSIGPNYGCCYLVPGYSTWRVNDPVPLGLRTAAVEIMAFDALIDNADRRREKPNLLWKDDEIFIIDHELSFSFVYLVGKSSQPFNCNSLGFLRNHPLYAGLLGRPVDLSRFTGELESIDEATLESFFEEAPAEFGRAHKEKVVERLISAAQQPNILVDSLRRILS
jgi:hypothetical protein